MKIAVLGDTHLGRSVYGFDMTGFIEKVLWAFVEFCEMERVDVAVHLGDLFDTPRPSLQHETIALQFCNAFEFSKRKLFILTGNHDVVSAQGDLSSASDVIGFSCYQHVKVISEPTLKKLGSNLALWFLPFPSPSRFASKQAWLASIQDQQIPMHSDVWAFAHLNVDGARLGSQDWVYRGGDYGLPSGVCAMPQVQRVICGHIHKPQTIGKIEILGAAQRLRFDEAENLPTFGLIDTSKPADQAWSRTAMPADTMALFYDWTIDLSEQQLSKEELYTVFPHVQGALVKVQPIVAGEGRNYIDWHAVTSELYSRGALFVKMQSPKRTEREVVVQARSKASVYGEPLLAARSFLENTIVDNVDRAEIYSLFETLHKGLTAGGAH